MQLEAQLGPTLTRSRAAQLLGVSQTALERWVAAGQIPIVVTPAGRREVPRQFVIELREAIAELVARGRTRHPLAAALAARREAAARIGGPAAKAGSPAAPEAHRTAERRGLAVHRVVAERLDETMVQEASRRVERSGPRKVTSILATPSAGGRSSRVRWTRSRSRSSPTIRRAATCARTVPSPAS